MVLQILQITKQNDSRWVNFDLHGAMNVEGMDDPEGDFIKRIRNIIGKKTIISAMIYARECKHDLIKNTDLITCYRKAT